MTALKFSARSDRGLVRANNEDSAYAGPRLLALADGMGGHAAGEVASQLMIAALAPLDDDEPGRAILDRLDEAVRSGNDSIADEIGAEPELDGMGTTLTAMLFSGTRMGLCHVGDSRAYLLRDDELTQITRDDTFVQTLVDQGQITPEEAVTHPRRSLIMKALTGEPFEPTLVVREVRPGDRYLLCSDGLSDPVRHETIAEALRGHPDLDACADRLIELALRSGGPDNVTVIVADVVDHETISTPVVAGAVGDDLTVAPPNTAAGRAAAIRPRSGPKRVVTTFGPESEHVTSGVSRRAVVVGALGLVALLLAGVVGAMYLTRNRYHVGVENGEIVIVRGDRVPLLGNALRSIESRVCLVDTAGGPRLETVDATATCNTLRLDDLSEVGRTKVENLGTSGRADAERTARELEQDLLPPCPEAGAVPTTPPSEQPPVVPSPATPGGAAAGAALGEAGAAPASETSPATPAPAPAPPNPMADCRERR